MHNNRTEHSQARVEWLSRLSDAELRAHVDALLAGPLTDHVIEGICDRMSRLTRKSILDWEEAQERRR